MTEVHPAHRAALDRELSNAVDALLLKAAEQDGKDVIEANVELTNLLLANLTVPALAASAAALALRLHRERATPNDQAGGA